MEAIALLCTLHADGPATVKRLRSAGCASLSGLLALDPERLASILGAPPAVARRFLREAKGLNERLGNLWNERDEWTQTAGRARSDVRDPAAASAALPAQEPPVLQGREQRIMAEVLATWRRKDAQETEAANGPVEARPAAVPTRESGSGVPASTPGTPGTTGTASTGGELSPGLVDGLDADACARLSAVGVVFLDELARADPVAVGRASGLGFTRVSRWRSLAERVRRARPASGARAGAARAERASQLAPELAAERALAVEPPRSAPLVQTVRRPSTPRFSPSDSPPCDVARGLWSGLETPGKVEEALCASRPSSDVCAGPFA